MRDGVVVGVESYVGGLADCDLDTFFAREGVVGELEQMSPFFGKHLGDGALGVLGTGALGGTGLAPLVGLVIEVVEVVESPGAEEALAGKSDMALHPALLISTRGRDGARLEAVVSGELEQRGVEADGVGAAFEHDATHVVEQYLPHPPPPSTENASTWPRTRLAREALR